MKGCNQMAPFPAISLFSRREPSKTTAMSRIKVALTHDRADCSPENIERMKNDLIQVFKNYMEIDETELDVELVNPTSVNSTLSTLFINIPVISMRRTPLG